MFNTLLFDFDGTLVDTIDLLTNCKLEVLKALGFNDIDRDAVEMSNGIPIAEALALSVNEESSLFASEGVAIYNRLMKQHTENGLRCFPRVESTLHTLASRGVNIGVFGHRDSDVLYSSIRRLGLADAVGFCIGENDAKPKPDKRMIDLALEHFNVTDPQQALLIGDTTLDLEMGHRAGTAIAGVTYGAHSAKMLSFFRPQYLIYDFAELLNIV